MRLLRSIPLCGLLLTLALPLRAQSIPSPFEYIEKKHSVGLFGGYLNTNTGSRDVGPEPGPVFGARYGIQLTGPLSGEVALSFAPSSRQIYSRPVTSEPDLAVAGEANAGLFIAEAGFRFHLTGARTWNRLAPFIVATAGVVTDLASKANIEDSIPEDQRFDFGPGFAAGAGVGTDFFVTDWLSVRAEAKDYLWRFTYPIGLAADEESTREWTHNFGVLVGAAFHF